MDFTYTILIPLLPLFLFIFIGLTGHKMKPAISGLIGTTGMFISAILSYYTAYQYFFKVGKIDGVYHKIIAYNSLWLNLSDKLHIDMGVLLDHDIDRPRNIAKSVTVK